MKLLITDDEELTRTGVVASIDWQALGIDEILQADDGIHGLEMAKKHSPEIILCDIRMPRMDGITMFEHIKHFLPDTVVIFMSGYSDKEYLKAAIKLKAVNYIEKPLNLQDIREAITEAINIYNQNRQSKHVINLQSQETASNLALLLSAPYVSNAERISSLCQELSISFDQNTSFTVFIIKMDGMTDLSYVLRTELYQKFETFLKKFGLHCLHTEKHNHYLVYFVYGTISLLEWETRKIGTFLVNNCEFLDKYMVVSGDTYVGAEQAFLAYNTAVVVLQSSFFFQRNTYLSASAISSKAGPALPDPDEFLSEFSSVLVSRNKTHCSDLMEQLFHICAENPGLLQGQIQDFYYKLLFTLEDTRKQLMIAVSEESLIADIMTKCFSYQELHAALLSKLRIFFEDAENLSSENRTITMIKEFISQNYNNETLSVKDISAHVYLSTSYVCTFFKNETGQTLNQYLTEFRMEKAKALLGDPRYKITDISSKVGYNDGNYFGKSFKKYSGLSPSEYREKIMS